MARPRLPAGKAEISGASLINAGRFADRKTPKRIRPLGEPYLRMSDAEKEAWREFAADWPWLNSGHRQIVRLACIYAARIDEGKDLGVSATQAFSSILSKLGATPVDETKVNHADGDEGSDEDRFFGRSN